MGGGKLANKPNRSKLFFFQLLKLKNVNDYFFPSAWVKKSSTNRKE